MGTFRTMLLASLLALGGCSGTHVPDGGASVSSSATDPARPMSASLVVRDGQGAAGPFRISDLDRLVIEVRLRDAPQGPHDARLEISSPEGSLFGRLPLSVDVDPAGKGAESRALEVRGTSIESLRRTGTWAFRLYWGDTSAAVATAEAQVTE